MYKKAFLKNSNFCLIPPKCIQIFPFQKKSLILFDQWIVQFSDF